MASGSTDTNQVEDEEKAGSIGGAIAMGGDEARRRGGMNGVASSDCAVGAAEDGSDSGRERWAAIRRFIEGSMETRDLR